MRVASPVLLALFLAALPSWLEGSGGTILLEGVRSALSEPEDREKLRIVAFMTDGYIGKRT